MVPLLESVVHVLVSSTFSDCLHPQCQCFLSEFRFVLQFQFASSSGSLLSFGSAILLIARCASVRICCPHSQFCPRPRFVHILVLVHILGFSCPVILRPLVSLLFCPRQITLSSVMQMASVLYTRFVCMSVHYTRPFVRVRRTVRLPVVPLFPVSCCV